MGNHIARMETPLENRGNLKSITTNDSEGHSQESVYSPAQKLSGTLYQTKLDLPHLTSVNVLALQRSIGNRAVASLLQRQIAGGKQDSSPAAAANLNSNPASTGIGPGAFTFHSVVGDDGKGVAGGWQETDCEIVRFVAGVPFAPQMVDVRVRVGVPLRNKSQGTISPQRAQAESKEAATLAGIEVTGMLDMGDIAPSQIEAMFIELMGHYLLIDGKRVTTCTGGSKNQPLMFYTRNAGAGNERLMRSS